METIEEQSPQYKKNRLFLSIFLLYNSLKTCFGIVHLNKRIKDVEDALNKQEEAKPILSKLEDYGVGREVKSYFGSRVEFTTTLQGYLAHLKQERDFRQGSADREEFSHFVEIHFKGGRPNELPFNWLVYEMSKVYVFEEGSEKGKTDWDTILNLLKTYCKEFIQITTTPKNLQDRCRRYVVYCQKNNLHKSFEWIPYQTTIA